MRGSDRGSVTLWVLGLSIMLLAFGGLAVDFWRALALQRELAAVADSAAIAGASGIDEEHYRATGEVILSPERSTALALYSIRGQDAPVRDALVDVAPDRSSVTVEVGAVLELGLLGLLVDDSEPLGVTGVATAVPEKVP